MYRAPRELSLTPVPLVGLVGLDVANSLADGELWKHLAINRSSDRVQLYYKLIMENGFFKLPKPVVSSMCLIKLWYSYSCSHPQKSYDNYVPKGILKANWLAKHLFQVPSVVVFFHELTFDDLKCDGWVERLDQKLLPVQDYLLARQTKVVLAFLCSGVFWFSGKLR